MAGAVPASVIEIRASNISLVAAFGHGSTGDDILVPLIDWQTFGNKPPNADETGPNDFGQELSSHLITLENLAFLLQDMGSDMREAIRILALQARGGAKPQEGRMRYTLRMLRRASEHISAAAEHLEQDVLSRENGSSMG